MCDSNDATVLKNFLKFSQLSWNQNTKSHYIIYVSDQLNINKKEIKCTQLIPGKIVALLIYIWLLIFVPR